MLDSTKEVDTRKNNYILIILITYEQDKSRELIISKRFSRKDKARKL